MINTDRLRTVSRQVWNSAEDPLITASLGFGARIAVRMGLTAAGIGFAPAGIIAIGTGSAVAISYRENRLLGKWGTKGYYDHRVTRHDAAHAEPWTKGRIWTLPYRGVKRLVDNVAHGMERRATRRAFKVDDRKGLTESVFNVVFKPDTET